MMPAQTIISGKTARRLVLAAAGIACVPVVASGQANFGAVSVGASATNAVTVTLPNAATLGGIAVVTQGATGLDFTNAGGGTCAVGMNYAAGESCTAQVTFNPLYAGERYGAVLLMDGSGNRIGIALLAGIGVGPQIVFEGGAAIALAPMVNGIALNNPFDPVVDGIGNLYFTDQDNARVVELPVGGGAPIAIDPSVGGSGLSEPGGVAVNAAGDLYISDLDRNIVIVVPAGGGQPTIINPMVNGMGLRYPCGMAIDGAGDLYIADVDNARVVEVPAGGGAPIAIDPLVDGAKLSYPVTVALNSAGDLFIADLFGNRVVKVPAGGGAQTAIDPSVNGQSLDFPYGVAVDAAGDLYIADANNRVVEVPAGGGAATAITPTANGKGLNDPIGIGLDAGGNLLIADSLNDRVVEVMRAQAPAVNFAATAAGAVSSDSPKTVTVQNAGNAALTIPAPGSGNNPAIATNFTLGGGGSACPVVAAGASQAGTLAAGDACSLSISFQPVAAGTVYGSLTLEDNNLNAANPSYATQTIALSGDAPVATVSSPMVAFGPQQVLMTSAPQQVTLTNNGSAALTITKIEVTGANASAFSFPDTCGSSLAAGADCIIAGQFTPATAGPMTAVLSITDNASDSPQKVNLTGAGVYPVTVGVTPSATNVTTSQSLTVAVTVSGASGEPTPTGSIGLANGSFNLGTAALAGGGASFPISPGALPVGTDTIVASYRPDNASAALYVSATGQTSVTVTASSTATAPAASTSAATAVTSSAATLAATVNPNGSDTRAWFLWGTSSTLSGAAQTTAQDLGAAIGSNTLSATLSGLSANTIYYYQVVAQNSVGTTNGAILSFTTDFTPYFSVLTGAPLTVARGATTGNTSPVSLTAWYGFTGTVNLSCAITPVAANDPATCSLPASALVSGDENATVVTLTVNTTAASAMNRSLRLWPGTGGAALACVVLLCVPLRRQKWIVALAWVALFAAVAGVGCGGGSAGGGGGGGGNGPPPNPGTTPGTYTVTVTGVSGSMTETGTLALTVQ